MPVIALEPRPETRAQEGGLSRSRSAKNHQHAVSADVPNFPQRIEAPNEVGVPTEENRGILGFERFSPRYGARSGSLGGGQGNVEGSSPAFCRPSFRRVSPATAYDISLRDDTIVMNRIDFRPLPAVRSPSCRSAVIFLGNTSSGVGSIRTPKTGLPSCLASKNSQDTTWNPASRRDQKDNDFALVGGLPEGSLPALAPVPALALV